MALFFFIMQSPASYSGQRYSPQAYPHLLGFALLAAFASSCATEADSIERNPNPVATRADSVIKEVRYKGVQISERHTNPEAVARLQEQAGKVGLTVPTGLATLMERDFNTIITPFSEDQLRTLMRSVRPDELLAVQMATPARSALTGALGRERTHPLAYATDAKTWSPLLAIWYAVRGAYNQAAKPEIDGKVVALLGQQFPGEVDEVVRPTGLVQRPATLGVLGSEEIVDANFTDGRDTRVNDFYLIVAPPKLAESLASIRNEEELVTFVGSTISLNGLQMHRVRDDAEFLRLVDGDLFTWHAPRRSAAEKQSPVPFRLDVQFLQRLTEKAVGPEDGAMNAILNFDRALLEFAHAVAIVEGLSNRGTLQNGDAVSIARRTFRAGGLALNLAASSLYERRDALIAEWSKSGISDDRRREIQRSLRAIRAIALVGLSRYEQTAIKVLSFHEGVRSEFVGFLTSLGLSKLTRVNDDMWLSKMPAWIDQPIVSSSDGPN